MSVANTALLYNLGLEGFSVTDNLVAGASGARNTALKLNSQLNRITSSPANGAAVLPSLVSLEAPPLVFVVNDSSQTVKVSAAPNENVNGTGSAGDQSAGALSIPAGQSGIFIAVPNGKGATLDWRSAVIP